MQATLDDLYRRLSELPSSGPAPDSDLPHDARSIADWVGALPRANLQAVQAKLRAGLVTLASRKMEGVARIAVLEQLRAPIHEVILQLEGQFKGASFPLAPAKVAAALEAQTLHLHLAHGYRQAVIDLCAPGGKVPMLRGGNVAMGLSRAVEHYTGTLREAWRVYRLPLPGAWLGLHACAAFAEAVRLDGKRVEDEIVGHSVTPMTSYLRTLIVATSSPYAHAQATQENLWSLGKAYAEHCRLVDIVPGSGRPIVPAQEDRPPEGRDESGTARQEIDLSALLNDLGGALERQSGDTITLTPSRRETLTFSREALQRIRRTLKMATERAHQRMPGGHELDSVIGLSSLHHYLAGGRRFDAFLRQAREQQIVLTDRAAWAHASKEAVTARRVPATVVDQSLGGYRLHWGEDARAKVGELVGLCLPGGEESEEWMVGVIRWLRYEDDGGITAGIELLARRARAAALVATVSGEQAPLQLRAIEIDALDGSQAGGLLSTPRAQQFEVDIEILRLPAGEGVMPLLGTIVSPARLRVVQNPGEYALLSAQPPVPGVPS